MEEIYAISNTHMTYQVTYQVRRTCSVEQVTP